ncbi:hypothetical protein CVIRNUC_006833 [Coccomyxa viridis]|uniref:Ribosome biogenesis protein NOP53 n=1 Tax=Coccomyxa viridis TaxID=1274662 RepID=A0AAV1ICD7_9CHLO|nr:hypothetical protein CVIRNUC_006833 [Coccomyxa viridis]
MAKGQAQRRRAKNFLAAKETKTGRLMQLPPSPDTVVKKGRKSSDVPRSLQRMLQLKALAQGPKRRKQSLQRGKTASAAVKQQVYNRAHIDGGKEQDAIGEQPMIQANLLAETQPAADLANAPQPDEIHGSAAAADLEPDAALKSKPIPQQERVALLSAKEQRQQLSRKHESWVARPAGISSERGLKPRKKDFLKRRKLKKKGLLHLLDEEPEEDLEAELLQDRHKPKFGEQAEAPLKINLKRKHWDSSARLGGASKHCTDIFQRQMSEASRTQRQATQSNAKQAATSVHTNRQRERAQALAIEGYRSGKRAGAAGKASLSSLKELVRKGQEGSASAE